MTAHKTVEVIDTLIDLIDHPQNNESKQEPLVNKSHGVDINHLIDKWDKMANWYQNGLHQLMAPTAQSLLPHLQLSACNITKDTFKLLDAAVGDGFSSIRIIKDLITYKSSFEYYGFDISKEMIKITQQNIKNDKLLSSILNSETQHQYKIDISVQNAEDLSQHKSNTFDGFISSLCLMLTAHPLNMLKEAYRVLKPNGISAFSIWGFRSKSNYFESFVPIYRDIENELKTGNTQDKCRQGRSNYQLADHLEDTIAMFKSVGFKTVYYWDINVAIPWNTSSAWGKYLVSSPRFNGLLSKCKNEEQREAIRNIMMNGLDKRFNEFVVKQNKAITHNNICIVAIK
eukprot:17378_1